MGHKFLREESYVQQEVKEPSFTWSNLISVVIGYLEWFGILTAIADYALGATLYMTALQMFTICAVVSIFGALYTLYRVLTTQDEIAEIHSSLQSYYLQSDVGNFTTPHTQTLDNLKLLLEKYKTKIFKNKKYEEEKHARTKLKCEFLIIKTYQALFIKSPESEDPDNKAKIQELASNFDINLSQDISEGFSFIRFVKSIFTTMRSISDSQEFQRLKNVALTFVGTATLVWTVSTNVSPLLSIALTAAFSHQLLLVSVAVGFLISLINFINGRSQDNVLWKLKDDYISISQHQNELSDLNADLVDSINFLNKKHFFRRQKTLPLRTTAGFPGRASIMNHSIFSPIVDSRATTPTNGHAKKP